MWRTVGILRIAALTVVAGCGTWADTLACGDQGCLWTNEEWANIESLAGLPDEPAPDDPSNVYTTRPGVAEFGEKLYYDTRFSGNASWVDSLGRPAPSFRTKNIGEPVGVSCATCHDPVRYGSDFTSTPGHVSVGAGWYDVNAQQTLNAAFFKVFYWNGRTDSLWAQAAQVMESKVSMNGHRYRTFWVVWKYYWSEYLALFPESAADAGALAGLLTEPPEKPATIGESPTDYKGLYDQLGNLDQALGDSQRKTITRVHVNVAKAIAAYEVRLRSEDSAFDRFVKAGPTSTELTPAAQRGLKLFIGRASCIDCHNTKLLSDQEFHNIGVPQGGAGVPTVTACAGPNGGTPDCDCTGVDDGKCLPWGAYAGAIRRAASRNLFSRQSEYSDSVLAPDSTSCERDGDGAPDDRCKGAWRTPSLRDVAMTAPYMHDGAFATLSDVVWHYDQASTVGGDRNISNPSELSPLALSARDRDDLVVFLESLTGVHR